MFLPCILYRNQNHFMWYKFKENEEKLKRKKASRLAVFILCGMFL